MRATKEEVIELAGGPANISDELDGCSIQAISQWKEIPTGRCGDLEELIYRRYKAGLADRYVTKEQMRPDFFRPPRRIMRVSPSNEATA